MKTLAEIAEENGIEIVEWNGRKWIKFREGYVAYDKVVAFCKTRHNGLVADAGVFCYTIKDGDRPGAINNNYVER